MFPRITRTVGAAGVFALALVVVQVALAEVPVSRFTAADQAAAKAAVLTLNDFASGVGWKGGLEKNAKAFTGEDCPGLYAPKQSDLVITGVAKSSFSAAGAQAFSGVQVYKTARMAQLDWNRSVTNPAALACAKRQAVAEQTAEFRFVSMKRTPFPRIGQRAAIRWRTIAVVTPKSGEPLRFIFDEVAFGRGRTGISFGFATPYKYRAAADAAEARIARTLDSRIRV